MKQVNTLASIKMLIIPNVIVDLYSDYLMTINYYFCYFTRKFIKLLILSEFLNNIMQLSNHLTQST